MHIYQSNLEVAGLLLYRMPSVLWKLGFFPVHLLKTLAEGIFPIPTCVPCPLRNATKGTLVDRLPTNLPGLQPTEPAPWGVM